MGSAFKQIAAIWSRLGINQKVTMLGLGAGVLAGLAVLVWLARRPSYELLYSDLEEKDMAQVVGFLKDSKVPYQISLGGKAILVPEGQKYDLRLGLANKGLMAGGHVGLELWESPGWSTSPLAEQMMKRRAMQGELARTIMHIQQVAWADVQVAESEPSLFAEDHRATTAAITLKLRPGCSLNGVQVSGIARLVAGSVEGLEPKNVTIIDEEGNLLSSPHDDTSATEASDVHAFRRACEEQLAAKAQVMLDRALGPGKSVVKVSAILDMDRSTETRESVEAESRVALTEKTTSKTSTTPAETAGAAAGSQSEETNESAYEVPKTVRTTQTAPGTIHHLDVAVILDPTYEDKDGKEATLTQQEVADLGLLVKKAVGLEETGTRKDTLQMTAMAFHKEPKAGAVAAAPQDDNKRQAMLQIAKNASAVFVVVIFVVFAGLSLRKVLRAVPKSPERAEAGAPGMLEMELYGAGGNGGGDGRDGLRNRVTEVMAKNPEAAARLLQRWISEDSGGKK